MPWGCACDVPAVSLGCPLGDRAVPRVPCVPRVPRHSVLQSALELGCPGAAPAVSPWCPLCPQAQRSPLSARPGTGRCGARGAGAVRAPVRPRCLPPPGCASPRAGAALPGRAAGAGIRPVSATVATGVTGIAATAATATAVTATVIRTATLRATSGTVTAVGNGRERQGWGQGTLGMRDRGQQGQWGQRGWGQSTPEMRAWGHWGHWG